MMRKIISLFMLSIFSMQLLADPLLLSDAEMQKLAKYFPDDDQSHLIWQGDPLQIDLPINHEKRIIFSEPTIIDFKGALLTDQIRTIHDGKSLYLTALKPFPKTRMYVTLQNSDQVLLVDLVTNNKAANSPTYVNAPNHSTSAITTHTIQNESSYLENNNSANSDTYVTLIRYAWKQLYAPTRLINSSITINRAAMHTAPMLSNLIYGDKVYAHPIASWVSNNTYVTVIELRNKYPVKTSINLNRDLCGNWGAASLYPKSGLLPAGQKEGDSVVLFLISRKPFGESMEVCNGRA